MVENRTISGLAGAAPPLNAPHLPTIEDLIEMAVVKDLAHAYKTQLQDCKSSSNLKQKMQETQDLVQKFISVQEVGIVENLSRKLDKLTLQPTTQPQTIQTVQTVPQAQPILQDTS